MVANLRRKRFEDRQAYSKNWKNREGGISPKAYRGLSKDDQKTLRDLGMNSRPIDAFVESSIKGNEHYQKRNNRFESAAWEAGYGNIKTSDQLMEFAGKMKDADFKDFDSMQDVHRFREGYMKDMIGKHAPKQEAASTDTEAKLDTPEKPDLNAGPIIDSPKLAQAKERANNWEQKFDPQRDVQQTFDKRPSQQNINTNDVDFSNPNSLITPNTSSPKPTEKKKTPFTQPDATGSNYWAN